MTDNEQMKVSVDGKEYSPEELPVEANLHLNRIMALRNDELELKQRLFDVQVAISHRESEVRRLIKEQEEAPKE